MVIWQNIFWRMVLSAFYMLLDIRNNDVYCYVWRKELELIGIRYGYWNVLKNNSKANFISTVARWLRCCSVVVKAVIWWTSSVSEGNIIFTVVWSMGTHGMMAKVRCYWELAPWSYLERPWIHLKVLRHSKG